MAERARRHIARRLLPFLFVIYITNYLDRTNLAYATLGMSRDLHFSDRVFGTAFGIFFIGYTALQIPGALLVERWSARRLIAATMIVWGVLSGLTGWVHTTNQLYLARFLLGAAEAGFFPGVIVYLTHWFVYEDRAKAVANFMAAIPFSFIIGSPLAGALLGVHWFGLQGWRWLFLLEGVPAVVLGVVTLFYLPDWPHDAEWLAPDERQWITAELQRETLAKASSGSGSVLAALRSGRVMLLAAVVIFSYTGYYAFISWFPTMLKRLSTFSDFRVGLFGSLPYIAAFIAMQVNGWHSDRTRERRWHVAIPLFLGAAALLPLSSLPRSVPLTLGLFTLVAVSVNAYLPAFWALPSALLSDSAAAASIGFINTLGNLGGFCGPYLIGYLYNRTHSFTPGLSCMVAALAVAGILVLFCPREPTGQTAT